MPGRDVIENIHDLSPVRDAPLAPGAGEQEAPVMPVIYTPQQVESVVSFALIAPVFQLC